MRVIAFNYTTTNGESNITSSSEQTFFPTSNLSKDSVSKEWRSNGQYTITSSNKTITINSTSYSLTEGTYNRANLITTINTLLSSENITLTFDENNFCFTFTGLVSKSYSGSLLNVLGMTAQSGLSITGLISIHTEEYINIDIKTTEEINSVVLLWSDYKLSDSAEIYFQASPVSNFSTIAYEEQFSPDLVNSIASIYLTDSISYRYFRIKIIDKSNVYGYVSLGSIVLGKSENITNCDNGFTFSFQDNSNISSNDFGVEYVDEYPTLKTLSIDFSLLEESETEIFNQIFRTVGTKKTIFIVLDETDSIFKKDLYFIYGKLQPQLNFKHIQYKYLQTSWTIREVL